MLRQVIERLSRGVVLKRRLPPQFGRGPLFVSPESGLKYYRSDLSCADPTLFRMAQELVKPADVTAYGSIVQFPPSHNHTRRSC